MNTPGEDLRPPSRFLLFAEGRAIAELAAFCASAPWLRSLPRGDGKPVLVLPGLSASDLSTVPMRMFLRGLGYKVYGWNLGRNVGYRPGLDELKNRRLREIADRHGSKVSLIGWSLGGIYARQLAKRMPEAVHEVITLGSPFKGHGRASNAWRLYEHLAGHTVDEVKRVHEIEAPPPVPFTSIYSRTDGVVHWKCCVEDPGPQRENVEIEGSHCGLGHHPLALYVIADRLAQPEGQWEPFKRDRTILSAMAFPDPDRASAFAT